MASPKSRTGESVPCDFCIEQTAVLYCRADSAKLCLFCDQHVHSANALSLKHIRSQICDNCSSEPVSVRCLTDNLVLCQECDWDAHGSCSVSASHDRNHVEGFSGCPSARELASIWGFDLDDKKLHQSSPSMPSWGSQDPIMPVDSWMYKSNFMTLQDLMVPSENGMIFPNVPCGEILGASKRQGLSCGKQKNVIYKQLVELLKRDSVEGDGSGGDGGDGGGGGENLVPATPNRNTWQGNVEEETFGLGNEGDGVNGIMGVAQQSLPQQAPFTSLLTLPTQVDPKGGDRIAEGDVLWDNNPNNQATQIWDFHLGKLRGHEESNPLEVGYGASNTGFMIKSYGEIIKESSLTTTKVLGEMYQMNCSMPQEDITLFINNSNNPTASQGPATSESNNLPIARPSSASAFGESKGSGGSKDIQFMNTLVFWGQWQQARLIWSCWHRTEAMLCYVTRRRRKPEDMISTYGMSRGRQELILGSE
ncbi:hypothetical protein L1049_005857 [Liquidambar formosana]|uniref:B box-type domain-containing protein n=1 Tax=Liquidambar formosana TaxID=63359 RepID=A0AAP0WTD3_LIQFO